MRRSHSYDHNLARLRHLRMPALNRTPIKKATVTPYTSSYSNKFFNNNNNNNNNSNNNSSGNTFQRRGHSSSIGSGKNINVVHTGNTKMNMNQGNNINNYNNNNNNNNNFTVPTIRATIGSILNDTNQLRRSEKDKAV